MIPTHADHRYSFFLPGMSHAASCAVLPVSKTANQDMYGTYRRARATAREVRDARKFVVIVVYTLVGNLQVVLRPWYDFYDLYVLSATAVSHGKTLQAKSLCNHLFIEFRRIQGTW